MPHIIAQTKAYFLNVEYTDIYKSQMGFQVHRVGMNLISVLPYQWSLLCISYIQSLMETDWLLWLSSAPLSHDPKKQVSMSDWKQTLSEFSKSSLSEQ